MPRVAGLTTRGITLFPTSEIIGTMIKLAIIGGAVVVGGALVIQAITNYLGPDDLKDCPEPDRLVARCAPADAIVAISGGDTSARVFEAIKLYRAGWAPKLIFSGAALDTSGPSNAEAMRRQALDAGVPISAIITDDRAQNTTQNAQGVLELLKTDDHRIILVTSPYHQRRANLEFNRVFGESIQVVNHPTPTDRSWGLRWWLTPSGWWLALSETTVSIVLTLWH